MKRIYHHFERWECVKAGFYETSPPHGIHKELAKEMYAEFLSNIPRFQNALDRVLKEWPNSCDQFLSNENINRIAWLGQASMCIETGIPSEFKSGFRLLSLDQQRVANKAALVCLNKWLKEKGDEDPQTCSEIYKPMDDLWLS